MGSKTRFTRRISAVSNAIQTKDNEANHLIIYCLNCIRHGRNATYEPGLKLLMLSLNVFFEELDLRKCFVLKTYPFFMPGA